LGGVSEIVGQVVEKLLNAGRRSQRAQLAQLRRTEAAV
jgi:hypothetical protein